MVGGIGRRGPADGDDFAPRRSARLRNKEPNVTKKVAQKRVDRSEPTPAQNLAERVRPLPEQKRGPAKKTKTGAEEVLFTIGKEKPKTRGRRAAKAPTQPPLLDQWEGRAALGETLKGASQRLLQAITTLFQRTPAIPRPVQTAAIVAGSFYAMYQGHITPGGLVGIAGIEAARTILNRQGAGNANQ